LHQLAIEKLGSSYFPQWTHMYTKWQRAQPEKKTKSLAEEKPKLE